VLQAAPPSLNTPSGIHHVIRTIHLYRSRISMFAL
jgi:hypothetical protein